MKKLNDRDVLNLYIRGKASMGYCAQILEMSEFEFVSFLKMNNISLFRFDSKEELLKDIDNA